MLHGCRLVSHNGPAVAETDSAKRTSARLPIAVAPSRCHAEKTKAPQTRLSLKTLSEQPSPEVCSQPPYVLICTVGMAPTCYRAHIASQVALQEEPILTGRVPPE
jgi:hypothetical protein